MSTVQNGFEQHAQLANQLSRSGRYDEALLHYKQALTIHPEAPQVLYNFGVTLRQAKRWLEARDTFETLLTIRPNGGRIHNNLAIALENLGLRDRAEHHFRRAIECNDQLADAHFNLGMLLLRLGRYQEGWAEAEWRWKTDQFTPLNSPKPRWDGSCLNGTLLLHTEQGAGDAMQFIRFLPQAAERCDRIMLVCTKTLQPLFECVPGVDEIRQAGAIPLSDFDAYIPLMSLPFLLGITLNKVMTTNPYLVAPQRRLPLPPPALNDARLKIGIIWAGSVTHQNDAQRSCTAADFLPLIDIPGTAFYSLQVAEKAYELNQLDASARPVVDLEELQSGFGDAAVLIEQLDLVITVDTAILHLAAALAKPVWGLLSFDCDWRWMLEREDSPWYPTLRLFRQSERSDWAPVFERVKVALIQHIAEQ